MADTIYCNLSTVNLIGNQASSKDQRFRQCRNLKIMIPVSLGLILLSVLTILHFARPNTPLIDGIIRSTSCGMVKGTSEKKAFVFKGIPYARPPVNDLRWRPTEPLNNLEYCWNGTREAVNSSQVCLQWTQLGFNGIEDCLYLDIYMPKFGLHEKRRVPVVVMIGADTLSGPSPGIMQPTSRLAHDYNMVFVRPNFRMDILGFLAVEPLAKETGTSGNYGLHDVVAALKWVQLNIENFGGDKDRVTVWGHRAGGTLVTALLGANQAKGLFSKVWISSASANFPSMDPAEYRKINQPFLQRIGCTDATCLRSKNSQHIMESVPQYWCEPNDGLPTLREEKVGRATGHPWLVRDDDLIQDHVAEIFQKTNLKIMIGTTAQSGTLKPLKYDTADEDPKKIDEIIKESLLASAVNYTQHIFEKHNKTLKALHTMISDVRVVCPLMTYALLNKNTSFYVSTFPRGYAADVDSDAAAILGNFGENTVESKRHCAAMQKLFKDFVNEGEVKGLNVLSGKRILIVDQDVQIESRYDNCQTWLQKGSYYGRID